MIERPLPLPLPSLEPWFEATTLRRSGLLAARFVVHERAPRIDAGLRAFWPSEASQTSEQVRRVIADARLIAEHLARGFERCVRAFMVTGFEREPRLGEQGVLLR